MQASVARDYAHRDKYCTPGEGLSVGATRLKWCEVAPRDEPVPGAIRAMARAFVSRLEVPRDLGFVILHRCGESFYFLMVQTWLNENEIWHSVYAKRDAHDPGFSLWPREAAHKPTFCVWELGAAWAEQQAWRRYLVSPRDEAAQQAYLDARFAGAV
ncbi:MAG: hypothetical protein ACT4OF_03625 [Caulobacteraceae bacterium]